MATCGWPQSEKAFGASELIMDATFDPGVHSVEDFLDHMELLFRLGRESLAGVPA